MRITHSRESHNNKIGKCLHDETMTLKEYIGYIKEIDPWITIGILGFFTAAIIYYILQRRYKDIE